MKFLENLGIIGALDMIPQILSVGEWAAPPPGETRSTNQQPPRVQLRVRGDEWGV